MRPFCSVTRRNLSPSSGHSEFQSPLSLPRPYQALIIPILDAQPRETPHLQAFRGACPRRVEAALAVFDENAALATGNIRHFPQAPFIVSPAEFVTMIYAD